MKVHRVAVVGNSSKFKTNILNQLLEYGYKEGDAGVNIQYQDIDYFISHFYDLPVHTSSVFELVLYIINDIQSIEDDLISLREMVFKVPVTVIIRDGHDYEEVLNLIRKYCQIDMLVVDYHSQSMFSDIMSYIAKMSWDDPSTTTTHSYEACSEQNMSIIDKKETMMKHQIDALVEEFRDICQYIQESSGKMKKLIIGTMLCLVLSILLLIHMVLM